MGSMTPWGKNWEITADAPKSPGKLGLCHVVSFLVEHS